MPCGLAFPFSGIPLLPIDLESLRRNNNQGNQGNTVEYYNLLKKYEDLVEVKSSYLNTNIIEIKLDTLYDRIIKLKQQLNNI